MVEFQPFEKVARLNREIVVTEKLDGTNAAIQIVALPHDQVMPTETPIVAVHGDVLIYAQSRTKFITPGKQTDNYGFAQWVKDHATELAGLGFGTHFGEWWGAGIQRRYGLAEERFSLFNVSRWADDAVRPACCHVVPTLYRGLYSEDAIAECLAQLRCSGSKAAPGCTDPEGIVVFHTANNALYKVTLKNDDVPKSKVAA